MEPVINISAAETTTTQRSNATIRVQTNFLRVAIWNYLWCRY